MVLTPTAKRRRTSNIQRTVVTAGAYEVEQILGYKLNNVTTELKFLVQWKGYDESREFLFYSWNHKALKDLTF